MMTSIRMRFKINTTVFKRQIFHVIWKWIQYINRKHSHVIKYVCTVYVIHHTSFVCVSILYITVSLCVCVVSVKMTDRVTWIGPVRAIVDTESQLLMSEWNSIESINTLFFVLSQQTSETTRNARHTDTQTHRHTDTQTVTNRVWVVMLLWHC